MGEKKKWNLAKPDFTRLGDSESLWNTEGGFDEKEIKKKFGCCSGCIFIGF